MKLAIEGGLPIRSKPWPTYDKGDVILDKEDEKFVIEALRSNLLFRYDYRNLSETPVGKFEESIKDFFKTKHALAVSSGTVAISLPLMSLGIKKGDEVGFSAFTFVATPSAIIMAGGKPVAIEVDENLNLDVEDLKQKYNPNMKSLVVVHMRGYASDMNSIMDFASSVGLKVIEDVVPAMGLKFKEKYLGTWGHFGAFSTQSDKSLNTGEGGILVTNDDFLFAKAVVLSGAYEDRWKKHFKSDLPNLDDSKYPLYSFRMDNIRGALGYSQLKKLPLRIKKLSDNYNYIVSQIANFKEIEIRKSAEQDAVLGDSLLFKMPYFTIDDIVWFTKALQAEGIDCRAFSDPEKKNIRCFWNWGFLNPELSLNDRKKKLPNTAKYLEKFVDIPLSPTLEKNDLDDLFYATSKVLERMNR